MRVRGKAPADQAWVEEVLRTVWGGLSVVVHGRRFDPAELPALIAGEREGLLTYEATAPAAEIVTLNALVPLRGVGTALVEALAGELAGQAAAEIRVTMTNDNLDALRFYQRRGFRLAAVRSGAVVEARRLKPSIPAIGNYGIPRHDELELVRRLTD